MTQLSLLVFFLFPAFSYPVLLIPFFFIYAVVCRGVTFFSDAPYLLFVVFGSWIFVGFRFFLDQEYSFLNFFEYYRIVFLLPFFVVAIKGEVAAKVEAAMKIIVILNFCCVIAYFLTPESSAVIYLQNLLSAENFAIQKFPSIAFRNTGVFRNPAEHAMIMFCFVTYYYLGLRRGEGKATLLMFLMCVLSLLSAQVKSAYVILPLLFLFVFLFEMFSFRVDRKLLFLLVSLFLGLVVLIQFEGVYQLTKLVAIIFSGRILETSSVVHRFEIWDGGLSLFRTPVDVIFGVGRHNMNNLLGTVDNDGFYFLFSFGALVTLVLVVMIVRFVASVIAGSRWRDAGVVILSMWLCLLIAGMLQGVIANPKIVFMACLVNLLVVSGGCYETSRSVVRICRKGS